MEERSGNLVMHWDTGIVYLRPEDGGDDEYLGFIGNPDDCPEGSEPAWAVLNDLWEDSRRAAIGYAMAVDAAWYGRFDASRMR